MSFILSITFLLYGQSQTKDTTFVANGNPIIKNKYSADPAALVHNAKFYLYAGHDVCPPKENRYVMNNWLVYSTSDMKTWTEHPTPLRVTDFAWSSGDAWASQVIERNGKFYWLRFGESWCYTWKSHWGSSFRQSYWTIQGCKRVGHYYQ